MMRVLSHLLVRLQVLEPLKLHNFQPLELLLLKEKLMLLLSNPLLEKIDLLIRLCFSPNVQSGC
jgi:hypothetical protein